MCVPACGCIRQTIEYNVSGARDRSRLARGQWLSLRKPEPRRPRRYTKEALKSFVILRGLRGYAFCRQIVKHVTAAENILPHLTVEYNRRRFIHGNQTDGYRSARARSADRERYHYAGELSAVAERP